LEVPAYYVSTIVAIFAVISVMSQVTGVILKITDMKKAAFFTSDKLESPRIKFVNGDILDNYTLGKTLNDVDTVIHLAAKVTAPDSDQDSHFFDQVNHWGTAILVDAAIKANIQHFIYLSSSSVYGSTMEPVDESYNPNPNSFYGISKLRGEEQVRRLNGKMKTHIIRGGNVYGYNPALRIDTVINKFMFEANFKNQILINGDGNQVRSFIHVDKLVAILRNLTQNEMPSGIYNAVEHKLAVNELVENVRALYPELEYLSLNQNLKMRHVNIKTPCLIQEKFPYAEKSISEELTEFKNSFAF
ncbi:MAG: SDR family oxidoreductase, partial [Bacteroidota bacterium]